ncbi:PQQ-binding-like beta-propeller repeat protein [Planctomycetota bacterium]
MKRITLCAVVCLVLCAAAWGDDWPHWGGPNWNGVSAETTWKPEALSKGPKVLWETNVGNGYSAMAVTGTRLYTMGNTKNKDAVFCLNADDGKEIWKHTYPCQGGQYPGPRSTPTVEDGRIYTVSYEGHVMCLSEKSGNEIWKRNLTLEFGTKLPKWGIACSAVIEGDMVLINANTSGIALDKKTGKKIWSSDGGIGGYASAVVFDDSGKRCAAIFGEKAVYVVDVKTGKKLSSYPWETGHDVNAADPIFSGGKLFISSGYKKGCALLDISQPVAKEVWRSRDMANHFGTCVLVKGHLYGISGNAGQGWLQCLEFKSGKKKWSEKLGFGAWTAAGDNLIVLTEKGVLIVVEADPSGYKEIAVGKALKPKGKCWTAPVLANGRIYCRSSSGQLVCIDVK